MHADSSASEGSQTEPVTTGDEPPEPFHLLTPAGFVPADHQWLSDHLGQILGHLPSEVEQINIRLLDDAGMSELHQQWKGLEGPTDVLSWFHSSGDQPIEADLAIGLEVAAREAAQRGHPIRQELCCTSSTAFCMAVDLTILHLKQPIECMPRKIGFLLWWESKPPTSGRLPNESSRLLWGGPDCLGSLA